MATDMTLTVGSLNILPYIVGGGYIWGREDEEGESGGTAVDGTKIMDRIVARKTLEITIGDLNTEDMSAVLQAIYPINVNLTYLDPYEGEVVTKTYTTSGMFTFPVNTIDGVTTWKGFTTKFTEKGGS